MGSLSSIAVNGQVYSIPRFAKSMGSIIANEGKTRLKSVSIREASTFPGFCNKHDQVFGPIESDPIQVDQSTAGLFAFRAVAREAYAKNRTIASALESKAFDRGKSTREQIAFQQLISANLNAQDQGNADILSVKAGLNASLLNNDWSEIRYLWLGFEKRPQIACVTAFYPFADFKGRKLQSLASPDPLDLITLSVIPRHNDGFALLSWFGRSSINERLAETLANQRDEQIADSVVQLAFATAENLHVGPVWWDHLYADAKEALYKVQETAINPRLDYPDDLLCPLEDGFASWGRVTKTWQR